MPVPPAAQVSAQTTGAPASFFDGMIGDAEPVVFTVQVQDLAQPDAIKAFVAGGQEIVATGGSFGDVSRFLQELPGVAASSDLNNDLMIRGGDPMENLFLLDGIQIPNMNSIATLGTTGGFGSMIDSAAIQSVSLFAGNYDAKYPERLSSVIEIRTLDPKQLSSHSEMDFGIQGIGGLTEIPVHASNLLLSAHHGLLGLMNQFGIDGLPSYTNELIRFRKADSRGNRLTILNLGGWDSIKIIPCADDPAESSTIDSQYAGQRETTGLKWQRVYSKQSFGVVNVSDSEQLDQIDQQDQLLNPAELTPSSGSCAPSPAAPPQLVYREHTISAFTTSGYRFEWSLSRFTVSLGSAYWLRRPHFQVDQPVGAYSPYSVGFSRSDSTSFSSDTSTGESGTFLEITARPLKDLVLSAGCRLQTFALGDHVTLTPRASLRYRFGEYLAIHASMAAYAQMPPYVYLLSFPQNRSLLPMRVTQESAGIDIGPVLSTQIRIEAYDKAYRDVPSSTEYPTVNLHDLIDGLGQQFVWLPMNSGGRGRASGMEFSTLTRIGSRLLARASVAYSRAMFAGLEGVMRPGNFDLPWIVNFAALQHLGRGYTISPRFSFTSGRPYTPFDLPDSLAQNRAVYDTTRMNAFRAPYYARLDTQVDKDILLHGVHMELYFGVNNILDRSNFLGYVWLPRAATDKEISINPVHELEQMPIFPNFGLRYIFR
ncbi:MAG TPA: TonB-dependent receptor [Terracidiphilus sp.]|nr:TonB-dependent receptor [Terracidiphilus sp.]